MKKIALCLYGLIGHEGKFGRGNIINFKLPYEFYKKNLSDNDMDIFIHSWSYQHKEKIVDLYNPVDSIFENPTKKNIESIYGNINFQGASQLYTKKKSIELKSKYENDNKFVYDWVFLSRFDICIKKKVDFSKLNRNKLYIVGPKIHHGIKCKCRFCDESRTDHAINDTVYFSSSKNMNILANCYDNIKLYFPKHFFIQNNRIDMHYIAKKHLIYTHLWSKVDYYFYLINNKYIYIWRLLQFMKIVPKHIVKARIFDTDVPLVRWLDQKKYLRVLDIIIFKGKIDVIYYYLFGWIHLSFPYIKILIHLYKREGLIKLIKLLYSKI